MCGESIHLYHKQWSSKYGVISLFARLCSFCSESKCHIFFAFSTVVKTVKAVFTWCLLMQQMWCVRRDLQNNVRAVRVYICAKNTRYPRGRNFFYLLGFGPFCMQVNFVFALHLRSVQCFFKDGKDCVYCRFVHLSKFDVRAWYLTVVYVQKMLWKLTHWQSTTSLLYGK